MDLTDLEFPAPARRVYCNRTLNLRAIKAVGFDMDYTLVHYNTREWEKCAYEHTKRMLATRGWPVEHLEFDPDLVTLGLVFDVELGNIVKANRFGYIKRAAHGCRMLEYEEQKRAYSRVLVDHEDSRWAFVHTLFALSEGCLYAQLVDMMDRRELPGVMGYRELYDVVRQTIDEAHMEGTLKADIVAEPERFVELDPDLPQTLLDLKHADKKLLLITNSEWPYTQAMMNYAFDRYLPGDTTWRDLFDVVIVSARKPGFFDQRYSLFEVVDEEAGLLKPAPGGLQEHGAYLGGSAGMVEDFLGVSGDEVLYIGDHIFSDVDASKKLSRWRTALVVRELEQELAAVEAFRAEQAELSRMMLEKERLEHEYSVMRLSIQRAKKNYGPQPTEPVAELEQRMQAQRDKVLALDSQIAPLAKASSALFNPRWGLLMRAGNDKSHLARAIERSADAYMSRVSNLMHFTPFVYLRSPRGDLPHDRGDAGGVEP